MDLDYLKNLDTEAYEVWKELDQLIEGGLEDSPTAETADPVFAVKMVQIERATISATRIHCSKRSHKVFRQSKYADSA